MRSERLRLRALRTLLGVGLSCASFATTVTARAEDAAARDRARAHFETGVASAQRGELEAAIAEFNSAYALSPHFSVLYNLAQAYAATGRPVEAAAEYERYLEQGGERISASRRAEVAWLLTLQRRRIGFVRVAVEPDGAELVVDGRSVGTSPLRDALALSTGPHGLVVRRPGFRPRIETLRIAPAATAEIALRLEPESGSGASAARVGQLSVDCELPGVDLFVNGDLRAKTPIEAPLLLPAGTHRTSFRRAGYVFAERSIAVPADSTARLACEARRADDPTVPSGAMELRLDTPGADVRVDGEAYTGGRLPAGAHRLTVSRSDFRPWSRELAIRPGETHVVSVALEPTPAYRTELRARKKRQRTWAIGIGAAGVALAGGAVGTFVWNSNRYDDWRDQSRAVDRAFAQDPPNADAIEENARLRQRAGDLQAADDIALGLAITAGVALGVSTVLWLLSSETEPGTKSAGQPLTVTW